MNEETQLAASAQDTWIQKIEKVAEEVARLEGCILYDVEFVAGRILRISIDKEAPIELGPLEGSEIVKEISKEIDFEDTLSPLSSTETVGVGIHDCSRVSHGLSEKIDLDDLVPGGPFDLEVSTPGIERPLKKEWHFLRAVGRKIWVKTHESFENYGVVLNSLAKAKQTEGRLLGVSDGQLTLEVPKGQIGLPLAAIEKSKVVFEIKKELKKKKN